MPISWDIGLSYPIDVYSHQDAFNVWDVKQNIKNPWLFAVIYTRPIERSLTRLSRPLSAPEFERRP